MERNVDKIKRLEHELGRWRKKVADTAKENEKLREALAEYADRYCANLQDWKSCTVAANLLKYYERTE